MSKKLSSKIVFLIFFSAGVCAFAYLNTAGRSTTVTSFKSYCPVDSTGKIENNNKIASKSDSLKKPQNINKNPVSYLQDVEIMKLIIQYGKESLPVLSLKDYIPFLK